MKKPYIKPVILFEYFELSNTIAYSCDMDSGWMVKGHADINGCYATTNWPEYGGVKVFNNDKCNYQAEDYCYGLFSGTANITFSS